jgi:hypothetical protein
MMFSQQPRNVPKPKGGNGPRVERSPSIRDSWCVITSYSVPFGCRKSQIEVRITEKWRLL